MSFSPQMQVANIFDAAVIQAIIKLTYAASLCYGGISDIKGLKIPNAVSLVLLALFFLNYWLLPLPGNLPQHLIAGGIAFVLTFALYVAGFIGAGDVKLISVLMLWAGARDGPSFLIIVTLIGGGFALFLLTLRQSMALRPSIRRYIPSRRLKAWARLGIFPYGIAICTAGLILMPSFFASAS